MDHIQMHLFQLLRRAYVGIYTTVIEEKNTNMVSADDVNTTPPIPGFPPMGEFDAQRFLEGLPTIAPSQNCPETTVFNDPFTPPRLSNVCVRQSDQQSFMSSLTGGASASTNAHRKRMHDDCNSSSDEGPSPKKQLTPIDGRRHDDGYSVASDDNSDGWVAESDLVVAALEEQLAHAQLLDDAAFPDAVVTERHEWEQCLIDHKNSIMSPPSAGC